jgi:hypothetical protein
MTINPTTTLPGDPFDDFFYSVPAGSTSAFVAAAADLPRTARREPDEPGRPSDNAWAADDHRSSGKSPDGGSVLIASQRS